MSDLSPAGESSAVTNGSDPRERVVMLGMMGLAAGVIVAVFVSFAPLVRWGLLPLAFASLGVIIGSMIAAPAAPVVKEAPKPVPKPAPKPHQLPQARVERKDLALGPNPWEAPAASTSASSTQHIEAAVRPDVADSSEPVALTSVVDHSTLFETAPTPTYLSHDGSRLVRPSDHELERARRAVAKMVADLAPEPGAFDAVCERLLGVGDTMATAYMSLGRETTDFEKVLGIDLFDRLAETRVTGTGLEVMTWIRWVFAALHEDGGRDDDEFFSPIAVAMASRYGGTSDRWFAAMSEPIRQVELGGVVEELALAAKAADRPHDLLPDPDAVDRILEAPQWM